MNLIFEGGVRTTRVEKGFHRLKSFAVARLKSLGVMDHETGIVFGGDLVVDVAYSMLPM
jgi:hypothetical protein